ncbi:MAG: prepilin-type N-terminal cleavage/methylation domain-containing protein [Candidatus Buchananbacteria bacterium]|jgi:prepilin-type N-terminal cleavage/methylation domain-containing protein
MNCKNKKGFTLIEIMISLTISILLFFILAESYSLSQKIYFTTDAKAEITQNGRVILDRLIRELRQTPDIITDLPETVGAGSPAAKEIIFQDGHDTTQINYIRYYLDGNNFQRQEMFFYFEPDIATHVYFYATDMYGNDPIMVTSTAKVIGEYVDDIEFWGDRLTNINLYLSKNGQSEIINTAVYGRNL